MAMPFVRGWPARLPLRAFDVRVFDGEPLETATALMRKHRNKQIWGWSLFGLGLGTSLAGNTLIWTNDTNGFPFRGLAVAWLGIAQMVASLAFFNSARHDLVNAVNIYNDAPDRPRCIRPPATAARRTLSAANATTRLS